MNSDRILITGGTGALGKVLIPRLQEKNYECMSISRTGKKIADCDSKKCSITDFEGLHKIVKNYKPDIIIHLAGLTGNAECETNPTKAFSHNVLGTHNILHASLALRSKIILASTREVYGNTQKIVNEDDYLKPINYNGITKMMAENLVRYSHLNQKIPYVILRFTNFYGENFEKRGISIMLKKAIEGKKITVFGGNQDLDLLHFEDAAEAVVKSLRYNKSDTFNIGTGRITTVLQILKLLEKKLKSKVRYAVKPYRKFEAQNCKLNVNNSKIKLKFHSTVSIDETLERMIFKWANT